MQDIRYAIRTLRKQPLFTLVAVLTLALGIGANTAIFSLLYQLLLRPLPYAHAERLVFVWNTYPKMGLPQASVSIPDYIDRKTQAPAVEDATLFTGRAVNLAEGGQPEQIRALAVTPSFFTTLGRQPFLGRGFTEDEAKPEADKYAILTYGLWQSRFGGDASLVGRDIRVNSESYRVVGVLPADFRLPATAVGILVPFSFTPQQMSDQGRGNEFSQMIARLRPGASIEQFNAQMATIVDRNLERLPQRQAFARTSGFGGYAIDIREQLVGDARAPLYALQGVVLAVLLIACANVANLLLMRATGRYRELAIRATLGAGQWRLVRQMITEGVVLSLAGAVGGLVLGYAGLRGLIALSSQSGARDRRCDAVPRGARVHPRARGADRARLRRRSRAVGASRERVDPAEGRQHARLGQPRDVLHARLARRRGDGAGVDVARRRGAADQELRADHGCRSRVLDRERADDADLAAREPIRRSAGPAPVLAATAREGRSHPWRDCGRPHLQRAVQRHGQLGLVLNRRLYTRSIGGRAPRSPGSCRRRLLPRDADSRSPGACVLGNRYR